MPALDGKCHNKINMKNMIQIISALSLLLTVSKCCGQSDNVAPKPGETAQKFHLERKQVLDADYLLFLPEGYTKDESKRWPLILFLHGAGERGANVWMVAKHGPPEIVQVTNLPFIVVSPLCPPGQQWNEDVLMALLDNVEKQYRVDTHRVYLTGLSMGGFGTWELGLRHPDRFAAIAPVCGGGETLPIILARDFDPAQLALIKSLGVWAFHGGKDPTVPPDDSVRMVDLLKKAGCNDVKLTIYPNAQHDSWTQAYAEPGLFDWFLKHSR
jgi:predicted peptidase